MTLRQRVIDTGRTLALIAAARSALSGAAAGLAVTALAWPFLPTSASLALGISAAAAVKWWLYVRARGPGFTLPAVSLWIEERVPALGYGLVTAVETGAPAPLERSLATVDWSSATRHAARKALVVPALMTIATGALLAASIAFAPAVSRIAGRVTTGTRTAAGALDVTINVVAPSYARRGAESHRNPPVVRALVGSELRVEVAGTDSFSLTAGDVVIPRE